MMTMTRALTILAAVLLAATVASAAPTRSVRLPTPEQAQFAKLLAASKLRSLRRREVMRRHKVDNPRLMPIMDVRRLQKDSAKILKSIAANVARSGRVDRRLREAVPLNDFVDRRFIAHKTERTAPKDEESFARLFKMVADAANKKKLDKSKE